MNHFIQTKKLLTLIVFFSVVALLVGRLSTVDAQEPNNSLDAADGEPQNAIYVDADGNVGVGGEENPVAPLHIHSTIKDRGLHITSEGVNTFIALHLSRNEYGYLNLGGGTKLRGSDRTSVFAGKVKIGNSGTSPAPFHIQSSIEDRGLTISSEGLTTMVSLHVAKNDYGYLDLGGGTQLQGNGRKSVFSGPVSVTTLEITGGADLAEPFVVNDSKEIEPGTVVILDHDNPGELRISNGAYDTLVAGVISGAGDIQPGLIMQHEEASTVNGEVHPVALTGKVYVKAVGPIQIGNLLTTSETLGYAMAVTNRDKAFGATLGKAMSSLNEGESGLVLVLVALQ